MNLPSRVSPGACPVAGLLLAVLLTLFLPAAPAAATPTPWAVPPAPEAPLPPLAVSWRSWMSDQATMIQVAVVVGAIAIFWLSRSPK
jgi:hypothetical protein